MDLVLVSEPGMFCLDIAGEGATVKWYTNVTAWSEEGVLPPGAVSRYWDSYQLIVDFDGDNELEILWLAPYPIVTDAATGALEAFFWHENLIVDTRAENGGWWGDVDGDGESEWICELREYGDHWFGTRVFCLTMNGKFPSGSPWPEFYHCAYPGKYQDEQDWLTLKAAYSNSLWFPIGEQVPEPSIKFVVVLIFAYLAGVGGLEHIRDRGDCRAIHNQHDWKGVRTPASKAPSVHLVRFRLLV